MELSEQSDSRLVYTESKAGGIPDWTPILSVSLPLAILAGALYLGGVSTVECRRVEPTVIICEQRRSRAFGLYQPNPEPLGQLTGAFVTTETRTDTDGDDYTVEVLYGVDKNGQQHALNLHFNAQIWANQINQFIAASAPETLTLQQDYRPNGVSLLLALVPAIFLLTRMFKPKGTGQLVLNKAQRQLRLQIAYRGQPPRILKTIALDDITAIAVVEGKDEDDYTTYTVTADTRKFGAVMLHEYHRREPIEAMANSIRQFLAGATSPNPSQKSPSPATDTADPYFPAATPTSSAKVKSAPLPPSSGNLRHRQVFYRTDADVSYEAYDVTQLSAEQRQALEDVTVELANLQFKPMGSFKTSRFKDILIHAYVHSGLPINAVVLQTDSLQPMVDLYSAFRDGASLTTSSMPGTTDYPQHKIFRTSYPNTTPAVLLAQHRDRLASLNSEHGGLKPASPTLRQLAIAMEDYFQRQPSGFFPVLMTYLRQLRINLFARETVTGG